MKGENHMMIPVNAEKAFDNIQHPFMMKPLNKLGIEARYVSITKAMNNKPTTNIIVNNETLNAFPVK